MGYGTTFNTEIYLNRQTFRGLYELDAKIKEYSTIIDDYKTQLYMFTVANPKDIVPKEWEEEPIRWIKSSISELLNSIEEYQHDLYNLQLFKSHILKTGKDFEEFNPCVCTFKIEGGGLNGEYYQPYVAYFPLNLNSNDDFIMGLKTPGLN